MGKRVTSKLWGILNITPDSFSDGGRFFETDRAIERAAKLIKDGAVVIDIGAESTRPGAEPISWQEEWDRLKDLLPVVRQHIKSKNVRIGLDSYKHEVIKRALPYIDIINDVSGLRDKKMLNLVKESKLPTVLMHNLSVPADANITIPENVDVMNHLTSWFKKKIMLLEDFGIESKQLILDPGIGFGKQPSQSLCILNRIGQLKEFGLPLLVGHSRKGFLKLLHVGSMAEMDFNTGIVSAYLTDKKVEHIRVHNVLLNKKLMALRKFMVDRNDGKSMGVLEAVALCLKNL